MKDFANAQAVATDAFFGGMRPDPMLTVSEWADRHRYLPQKSSAEPGPWSTDRTPYLREIMDCLSPCSPIETVVFAKGAQVGGTEAGNNWIGFVIDYAPAPMIAVQPTDALAKRASKQRIQPLIDECPRLASKVKPARSRDSGNTLLMKEFPGGLLAIVGANSAVGLRSMPARFLFLDETDGYPQDVDGEGDPVTLARARTRTFFRRKIFECSTPTFDGRSRIQKSYDESDQRKYYVPCPHCEHFQVLKWGQVKWPKGEPHKAIYVCESCKKEILEHHKTKMLERGKWIADKPGAKNGKVAGFHISALYSPLGWFSWGECAELWEKSQKSQEMLRGFINTVLGETWKEKGDAPEWEKIFHARESYPLGTVPDQVVFLTAGADVQKDRIEVEVVGWGVGKQSWSIDYRVIYGDTATDKPWSELDELVGKEYQRAGGSAGLSIRLFAIDSGFNTQQVYTWTRRHPITKVIAIKGQNSLTQAIGLPTIVDINLGGKKIRRGARVWPVGVNTIKAELYAWLRLDKPTDSNESFPSGFCHFPEYGEEYFRMLTAEQLVVRVVRGYVNYEWQKIRDRNEALDCRVYARAAAAAIGMDRWKEEHWLDQAGAVGVALKKQEPAAIEKKSDVAVNSEPLRSDAPVRRRLNKSFWDRNKRG